MAAAAGALAQRVAAVKVISEIAERGRSEGAFRRIVEGDRDADIVAVIIRDGDGGEGRDRRIVI